MGIREALTQMFRKNERVKELVEERRIQRLAEQRDKNSDERELERFYEEARQKRIKQELDSYRKIRQKENWKSDFGKQKYMFQTERPILKEKNIFKNQSRATNLCGRGMFLR